MPSDFNIKSKYASLSAWLLAVVGFIFFNGILYLFSSTVLNVNAQAYEKINLNTLEELKEKIKKFPREKHIVVIGSSVIQRALWCPTKFSSIQQNPESRVNVFKIFEAGFQLEYFTKDLGLFDSLMKYQPDLILIEDNMLLMKNTDRFSEKLINEVYFEYKKTLRNGKNSLFNLDIEECYSPDYVNKFDSISIKFTFPEIRTKQDNSFFSSVLESGKTKNLKIGLLRSPRSTIYNQAFSQSQSYSKVLKLRNHYLAEYNLDYIPFNEDFYWSYFLDEGHMNRKGQKLYSLWLLNTLVQYFEDK